jgi:hypothetical protein
VAQAEQEEGVKLDKDAVASALTAERVFDAFSIDRKRSAGQWRIQTCPECGPRTRRDAVTVSDDGKWHCKAHGCRGDVFSMVAGFSGLDCARDFPTVLKRAADIAGVDGELDEAAAARMAAQRKERERSEFVKRMKATAIAQEIWGRLSPTPTPKERAYLESRKLESVAGLMRFGRESICCPLYDIDGVIVNVVARMIEDYVEPKIRGLAHCSTMGSFGDPTKIDSAAGARRIIVVEGLADYLSASHLWPGNLVLGSHGCSLLGHVGGLAGTIAARDGRGILIVPHNDQAGRKWSRIAADAAIVAGVSPDDVEFYELEDRFKDLNDYLRSIGKEGE